MVDAVAHIVGAIIGGIVGTATVLILGILCGFGEFSDSFCTFQRSGGLLGFMMLGGLLGVLIGVLLVRWSGSWDSQSDED